MEKNWARAYKVIRVYEGGNVDDKRDPGGRTSRGVTQRVYDAFRDSVGKFKRDVYSATDDEVENIYHAQYWETSKCDELPAGIDLMVFDVAVNSGIKRAYKLLQAALRSQGARDIRVDGTPGLVTVNAAKLNEDHDKLAQAMADARLAFYKSLSTFATFGRGWKARNANCVKIAQAWATGSVGPSPIAAFADLSVTDAVGASAKAYDEHIAAAPINPSTGTGVTTVGVTGAGTVEVLQNQLQSAQDALTPLTGYLNYAQYAFTALVFGGVLLTFYSLYKNYRAKQSRDAELTS